MWPFVGAELRNYGEKKKTGSDKLVRICHSLESDTSLRLDIPPFGTMMRMQRPSTAEYPQPARQGGNKTLALRNSQQNLTVRQINDLRFFPIIPSAAFPSWLDAVLTPTFRPVVEKVNFLRELSCDLDCA